MSKQSDEVPRGRFDPQKMNAMKREDIERLAAAELEELGLAALSKPYSVYKVPLPDVKRLREFLRCSQSEFAERFGLSLRTVQQWEQGRASPDQPARILLTAIETEPDAVARAASVAIRRARSACLEATLGHHRVDVIALSTALMRSEPEQPYSKLPKIVASVRPDPNRDKKFAA